MQTERRHSKKRDAMRELLLRCRDHPSAEMLYARLKPQYPDLSLGTVYRNLTLFRESGDILCVGTVAGQESFDADLSPQAHFVCERCGAVRDSPLPMPEEGYIASLPGTAREVKLTVFGVCDHCGD